MKFKTYLAIFLFSLMFLFYPGNTFFTDLFSYNRVLFAKQLVEKSYTLKYDTPYVINPVAVPTLSAASSYVVYLPSFTPVFEKNAQAKHLPASTAKIITALVAVEAFDREAVVEVKRVVAEGQSMELVVGEKITIENLLYGLLVHSGNDAAYAIADHYPGGEGAFVSAMNKKAEAIYMKNSQFKNPAGLDAAGQYTTAYDLALAGRELLRHKELSKIVSIKSITVSDVDFTHFHYLRNVNKLLGEVAGIGGLKTGYTLDAGENLVSFYKKNGHDFLVVILKSSDRFADTTAVVNWIDTNIGYIKPENLD